MFAGRIKKWLKADRQYPPFVGMMSNGTSADVMSIDYTQERQGKEFPYSKMHRVADEVAQEVLQVHQTIQHKEWMPLKAAQVELTLQVRRANPQKYLVLRRCWQGLIL